jgi:uncharacterized membrane protein YjgN (DUF898 family)
VLLFKVALCATAFVVICGCTLFVLIVVLLVVDCACLLVIYAKENLPNAIIDTRTMRTVVIMMMMMMMKIVVCVSISVCHR